MKGRVQRNPVYDLKDFRRQRESNPGPLDHQTNSYRDPFVVKTDDIFFQPQFEAWSRVRISL